MRLGMSSFTQFINTQIFSQIAGCQLVQKTGVANGPGLAKGLDLAKSEGVPPATSIEAVEEGGEERRGGGEAVV